MDRVEFFWRQAPDDPWQARRAGDSLANAQWPLLFLYPVFRLERRLARVLLRVLHNIPVALPVNFETGVDCAVRTQKLVLVVGGYLGVVASLLVLAATHALVCRPGLFVLYALDVLTLALTQMTLIGAAARFLWSGAPVCSDRLASALPMLTVASATVPLPHVRGALAAPG